MNKKLLRVQEELETLQKNVSDSLDMASSRIEESPSNEPGLIDCWETQNFADNYGTKVLKESNAWTASGKKLEANLVSFQALHSDNEKNKKLVEKLQLSLSYEQKRLIMLEQEVAVLGKEKGFYERLYTETIAHIESLKKADSQEIATLREQLEDNLKMKCNLVESFKCDFEDKSSCKSSIEFIYNDETFLTSSMISNNVRTPDQQAKHVTNLRAALNKVTEDNKALKSELTAMETRLAAAKTPLYISEVMEIVEAHKEPKLDAQMQTESCLEELSQELDANDEVIEQMTHKIECLLLREIEMQSTINDLEFKLKCHRKYIAENTTISKRK